MPMYEYQCPICGYIKEELKDIVQRDDEIKCPRCGTKMKRIISKSNIKFIGDGWYVNEKKNIPEKMADKYDKLGLD